MTLLLKRSGSSYSSVFKQLSDRLISKPDTGHVDVVRAGFGIGSSVRGSPGSANSRNSLSTDGKNVSKGHKTNLIVKQPKRPAGAYACFMQKVYPDYQALHPGQNVSEIGKEISKAWKSLDSEKRQEFIEKAKLNKENYLEALKAFNSKLTEDEKQDLKEQTRLKQQGRQRRKLRAARRSLEMPSKPRNAYSFFVESMKREHEEDVIAFARRCGERWRSMDESAKKTFVDLAAKDHERYFRDISAWEMKMLQSGHLNVIRSKSRASTLSAMRKELVDTNKDHLNKLHKSKQIKSKKKDEPKHRPT